MFPYRNTYLSLLVFLFLATGISYPATPNDAVVHVEVGTGRRDSGDGVCFYVANGVGYVWTCDHIVKEQTEVVVTFPSRKRYVGKAVAFHRDWDLVLVTIKCPEDTPSIPIAEVDVEIDGKITVIGDSSQVADPIRQGKRIDLIKNSPCRLQTDITIGSGDSGGAFLNEKGELVGIVSGNWPEDPDKRGLGADLAALKSFWRWYKDKKK